MEPRLDRRYTAFADSRLVANGEVRDVALKVKEFLKSERKATILIFDDETSQQIELDLRGSNEDLIQRLEALETPDEPARSGPGRPKLGVVAREVTLLPRHWDWLSSQPGGASATLRKLVEEAKKKNQSRDELRLAQEAVYRFMNVMAGDRPNYEEALRALYARNRAQFTKLIADWPNDVRKHTLKLAKATFKE
jgi:hypothetical protein